MGTTKIIADNNPELFVKEISIMEELQAVPNARLPFLPTATPVSCTLI